MRARLGPRSAQRGQALLLVLVFVAAFLFVVWAALRLAGNGFLGLSSVQADTRSTYALDAGVTAAIEYGNLAANPCAPTSPIAITLNYAGAPVTVTVTVTAPGTCGQNNNAAVNDITVVASNTTRRLRAEIQQSQNGNGNCQNCQGNGNGNWIIVWEQFQ
jgi:hypothetical protein